VTDIKAERLLADLQTLAGIGGLANGGVDRVAWSAADVAGRRWFAERISEAGLEPHVDAALNVFGHCPGAVGPFVLTGSHLDSVPNGGRLDGAYGAIAALEVLRTLSEANDPLADRVEIVGFSDEEGVRFSVGLIGSLALCGDLNFERTADLSDSEGTPIDAVLAQAGREFGRLQDAAQHLSALAGFLELHIEQGPRMDAAGISLAVVSGIVGVHRERVRLTGTQNHAGTTPFPLRHDAGRAASRTAAQLRELVEGIDANAVANIGVMRFAPGGVNIVPGEADFTLELRHPDEIIVRRIVQAFEERLRTICDQDGCSAEIELLSWVPPARMDPGMSDITAAACDAVGQQPPRLWSGAGHDAAVLSRHVPTGMIFVPSIGGISHAPSESTADEHLVLGARALLQAVKRAAAQIK
jgi:N-carbamoyl-L-amino-acid hydrolase